LWTQAINICWEIAKRSFKINHSTENGAVGGQSHGRGAGKRAEGWWGKEGMIIPNQNSRKETVKEKDTVITPGDVRRMRVRG